MRSWVKYTVLSLALAISAFAGILIWAFTLLPSSSDIVGSARRNRADENLIQNTSARTGTLPAPLPPNVPDEAPDGLLHKITEEEAELIKNYILERTDIRHPLDIDVCSHLSRAFDTINLDEDKNLFQRLLQQIHDPSQKNPYLEAYIPAVRIALAIPSVKSFVQQTFLEPTDSPSIDKAKFYALGVKAVIDIERSGSFLTSWRAARDLDKMLQEINKTPNLGAHPSTTAYCFEIQKIIFGLKQDMSSSDRQSYSDLIREQTQLWRDSVGSTESDVEP